MNDILINFSETPQPEDPRKLNLTNLAFLDFFDNFIQVGGYVKSNKNSYNTIINVSDEYTYIEDVEKYFWFPLNECTSDMGLNSIYGALTILYQEEKKHNDVYLHCHAGANRSPMIKELYWLMRTGDESDIKLVKRNIDFGHLPCIFKLRSFLKLLNEALESNQTMGGMLDSIKLNCEL